MIFERNFCDLRSSIHCIISKERLRHTVPVLIQITAGISTKIKKIKQQTKKTEICVSAVRHEGRVSGENVCEKSPLSPSIINSQRAVVE